MFRQILLGSFSDRGAAVLSRQPQQALADYDRALNLARKAGDRMGEAIAFRAIGSVYDDIGQLLRALDYYNRALFIFRLAGNRSGETWMQQKIASVLDRLSQQYQHECIPA